MAAEDIENKVRKMSSQKPEDGKDLQQLQEAQNQIVQINAERQETYKQLDSKIMLMRLIMKL